VRTVSDHQHYDATQRRLIAAFVRHDANPYQLLDHWLDRAPPRSGFAWFKEPSLEAKTWHRLGVLHTFSKSETTQLANYAASLASLLLFERLFPQDFAHRPDDRCLTGLLRDWEPPLADNVADVLRRWAKNDHPVYAAWSDMRSAECVRLSSAPMEELMALGIAEVRAPKRGPK
jgi:hypothetical protein